MTLYRLSPTLWLPRGPSTEPVAAYGIDRVPEGPLAAYVTCAARDTKDPARVWAGTTFQRLRMPPTAGGCCDGGGDRGDAVTFECLPGFLSWALGNGYTLAGGTDLGALKPNGSVWLQYEPS